MCMTMLPMLMMASSAVGAVGAISSGNAAAAASKYEAKVGHMNAAMINDNIKDQREIAEDENRRVGADAAEAIGQQTVSMAAGNLDTGFGSPLRALLASADAAGRDAAHVMDNSSRSIRNMRQQQANFRSQANASQAQVKGLRRAGYLQAAGTVLGGASRVTKYKAEIGG